MTALALGLQAMSGQALSAESGLKRRVTLSAEVDEDLPGKILLSFVLQFSRSFSLSPFLPLSSLLSFICHFLLSFPPCLFIQNPLPSAYGLGQGTKRTYFYAVCHVLKNLGKLL